MSLRDIFSWVRGHKFSAAGLVLVVAGCIALVLLARRVHHLQPKARGGALTAAASDASGATPGQAGIEQPERAARMRDEFERAPDYLGFIRQAMSRPQEGGKFYALLAWRRCDDLNRHAAVAAISAGDDAFRERALASIQDFEKRCAGVQAAYADIQALYTVVTQQRGGRDFLMPAEGRGIVVPSGRDTANADIDAAIRTADRWAQAEALRDNAGFLDVGNSTGDDGVDRQLREWGAEIVACELVGTCRGGIAASLHCVSSGDCAHDDYRDVIIDQVPGTHRMIFDTMLEGLRVRLGLTPGRTGAEAPPIS
jgi:hypothetical protein